jgi:hypothetical protein
VGGGVRSYADFLAQKRRAASATGFAVDPNRLPARLFPFQRDIVTWAIHRGSAAIFAGTGLGKTGMQLSWAREVERETQKPVIVVAPLAVAPQTIAEGEKIGIAVRHVREATDVSDRGVHVINYDRLSRLAPSLFGGVVLDESSILKAHDGKTRTAIIEGWAGTRFRLACTATPAPNDYMELANHAEFLGIGTRAEMLATYFVHDGGETQKWRLKGHAEGEFWKWVASWAVMLTSPADLGYDASGYDLPPLRIVEHVVESKASDTGAMFAFEANTLNERRSARRASTAERVQVVANIIAAEPEEPWLVWCDLNDESSALKRAIPNAVEVRGSDSPEDKESRLIGFSDGSVSRMITKSSIAGFGMNWQHCARIAFCGVSDSWESFYQAIRRCYRFGQTREVVVHVVTSSAENTVLQNGRRDGCSDSTVQRRAAEAKSCHRHFEPPLSVAGLALGGNRMIEQFVTDRFAIYQDDCIEVVRAMPENSVHYSIFSPPFASLYAYSASDRDMGNCGTHSEFYEHFRFLIAELYRALKPGRLLSFHCMNLPTSKVRDGVIGLTDFRGNLIRDFVDAGFIFHSEVCVWKDPVTAMQRTKAIGLLYKQLRKDSALSRQGIPDYLVTMRKPGENDEPVTKTPESFPVGLWQNYASPVWMDINPSETLQRESAREDKDERHIAPLQLEVIRRAIRLWTNPNDIVLSPFAGIGSEGYESIKAGRRFVGAELKRSYYEQAVSNLRAASSERSMTLFAEPA